jgi:hypothetical protein
MTKRWLWTQKQDIGPSPRWGHAMAYVAASQRVALFGDGSDFTAARADTWEWDGDAWTQVADMGPFGRMYPSMAYDDSRQRLVLFGGGVLSNGSYPFMVQGDTWEWNGTEWSQVADTGPSPRALHAMTYDTVRQRVVLFGGDLWTGAASPLDTWEWDGTEWMQITDIGPPGLVSPAMVFDSSRECLVLFGGLGETWEWDNDTGWVKRQDMGPRGIVTPTMAYTGEHTVLFGTPPTLSAGSATAGQTWEWDGRLWTQRQDMGPARRYHHNLAHDSQRDRVVLFGGTVSGIAAGDTWELAIVEQPQG